MKEHGLPSTDRPHDKYFKAVFSIREVALEMLEFALPPGILGKINLDSLAPASDSFVDEQLKETFSDLVYIAELNVNKLLRICFLLEHKSAPPGKPIHLQLLRYLLNIWEADILQNRPFTAVIPIVVYHGKKAWKKERFAKHFKGLPTEFLPYLPEFEYQFVNLKDIPDETLLAMNMGMLRNVLLALKHAREDDYFKQNFPKVVIFAKSIEENDIVRFLFEATLMYLQSVTSITRNEFKIMVTEQLPNAYQKKVLTLYEQILLEGEEKGIEKGIEKGKLEAIAAVLEKHPEWSDEAVASLLDVPVEWVVQVRAGLKQ